MAFKPYQLPSGRWRGGYLDPITGKKIQRTADPATGKPFDYQWEAEEWSIGAEGRARSGQPDPAEARPALAVAAAPHAPTVAEHGDAYLKRRAAFLATATRQNYAGHLMRIAASDIGTMRLDEVERHAVETTVTGWDDRGDGRVAINGRLGLLRTIFRDAVEHGLIGRDPSAGVKDLAIDVGNDRILTAAEESKLLDAADPQLHTAVLVGLDAGLRWQEVYGLRAASVVGDYLAVTHVVERNGKLRAYPKGHRARNVPMTERLRAELAPLAQKASNWETLLLPTIGRADRKPIDPRPWDYHNHRSRVWAPTMLKIGLADVDWKPTGRIRKTGEDAGKEIMQRRILPEFGFHALRHTFGSRLAAAGVPRKEIAAIMGHQDEATTARYIHQGDDGRRLDLVRAALGS